MKCVRVHLLSLVLLGLHVTDVVARDFKVLHVASYRSDWVWVQDQLRGFQEGMGSTAVTVRTVDLDAKHSSRGQITAAAQKAHDLIESWKPDLVFTTDDVAQKEVATRYINQQVPIVYSGVNKSPAQYGFHDARNITGVLEREHFAGTLALLREIRPTPRLRLAIVLDDDPTWLGVAERIRAELAKRDDVEVTHWLQPATYVEYKKAILDLQDKVDAVGLLGIFRFRDGPKQLADYETVLRWTAEHSRLPDFSFWETRVERGTLCAVTVSGIEMGRIAGRMARRILVDKVAPASIAPEASTKGRPMISLARARSLGVPVSSGVLLNANVFTRYAWQP